MGGQSAEEIETWIVSKLADILHMQADQIDTRESFAAYGLDSASAVELSGDLEDWLGRKLSATLAFDYPNVEALARHLAGKSDSTEQCQRHVR